MVLEQLAIHMQEKKIDKEMKENKEEEEKKVRVRRWGGEWAITKQNKTQRNLCPLSHSMHKIEY